MGRKSNVLTPRTVRVYEDQTTIFSETTLIMETGHVSSPAPGANSPGGSREEAGGRNAQGYRAPGRRRREEGWECG